MIAYCLGRERVMHHSFAEFVRGVRGCAEHKRGIGVHGCDRIANLVLAGGRGRHEDEDDTCREKGGASEYVVHDFPFPKKERPAGQDAQYAMKGTGLNYIIYTEKVNMLDSRRRFLYYPY